MHTKNQISLIRKALYGIMLFGLLCSVFGAGKLPSVYAQEAKTDTPTPEMQEPVPSMAPLPKNQNYLRHGPLQAESDVSAQALTLGTPGLSFSYAQTFGTTSSPYLADEAHLNTPNGLFIDASNTLFVTEEKGSRVLAYDPTGSNTMTLGHAGQPWGHDDFLSTPKDVAKDADGNIWIVFNSAALKEFDSTGSTVIQSYPAIDNWEQGSTNDRFSDPRGIAFDAAGLMYISDGNNHRIQVYNISGAAPVYVRTIGVTGAPQSDNTGFDYPGQIAFDGSGNLYVVDTNNYRVQRCTFGVDWTCSTFFGVTGESGNDLTHLDWANGITIKGSDIFIADSANARVLKCTTSAVCALFAGETGVPGTDTTHLDWPADVAVNSSGDVFVSDVDNYRVQKFDSAGIYQSTIGVTGVPYLTDNSHFNKPWGIAVAPDNSIYIVEQSGYRLIKLNSSGVSQWSVGEAGIYGSDNAHFGDWWAGLEGDPAIDTSGRVYVGDTGNHRVQIFNSNGSYYATLGGWGTGNYEFNSPDDVAISPVNGDIYVLDKGNQRVQVFTSGLVYKATLGMTGAIGSDDLHFSTPWGMTVDNSGNIYVGDGDNYRIQKCILTASAPGYSCSTFAGETGVSGDDFGHLGNALSVKVDSSGRVYVADEWNSRIQVFDSSGAYLTTIAGRWDTTNGSLISPSGVALDSSGSVYVTDRDNHRIQKFTVGTPGWVQSNINGFGDRYNTGSGISLQNFGDYLYAGLGNDNGGQLWRTANGSSWVSVTSTGFGNTNNVGVLAEAVFNGFLYAGTWNSTTGCEMYRASDGTSWGQVASGGFGNGNNTGVAAMAVFGNNLYVSTYNETSGTEVWQTPDGTSWTQANVGGFGDPNNVGAFTMAVFGDALYVGSQNSVTGTELWRTSNGTTWEQANADGFGDSSNQWPTLTAYNGYLYVGIAGGAGTQIWRSTNGTTWNQVVGDGFGDSTNGGSDVLTVFEGVLFSATYNDITGTQTRKTTDGVLWTKIASDGFGDSNNYSTYGSASFKGHLFLATANNINGTETWSMDLIPTVPISITRASPNPTAATSVNFAATFSKPVTGVDITDFKLTDTLLTGTSITGVIGSGAGPYTVTVNTGTGNGTIRLDIRSTATIQDLSGNALVGPYTSGETYTVFKGAAPTVPVLKSPSNNAVVTSLTPTLDWGDSSEVLALAVSGWHYEINVTSPNGYNETFTTVDSADPLIGLGTSQYTFATALPESTAFTWKVRAYNDQNQYSAWSASRTFRTPPAGVLTKLPAPVLTSPANTTSPALNNTRPTFSWEAVSGATSYTLQILSSGKVVNTGTIKAPLHSYTPTKDLLPDTTYTWQVKANGKVPSDYSAPFTFKTSANPPAVPALVSPANKALVSSSAAQTLMWKLASGSAASYEVDYATDAAFSGSTVGVANGLQFSLPAGSLLSNRTYYWRVRSWSEADAKGNHSYWSAVWTFRTKLESPVLNLPANGTTLDSIRPTFTWDEVPGATTYTLQVLKDGKVVVTGNIKAPAYVYTPVKDLLPGTTYTWKVKANGANPGDYSAPSTFTTSVNPPKPPMPSAPANNALVDSGVAQVFKWGAVLAVVAPASPAAGSYEVEYATNAGFINSSPTVKVTAPATETAPITLLPGRTYYWHVRSWSGANGTGNHSAWSKARTIKVKFVAPTLTSPIAAATNVPVRPTFTWSSANGLWTFYTLQIAPDNTFGKGTRTIKVNAPTTKYTIPDSQPALSAGAQYCWRVKINGVYIPITSSTQCFTTP